MNNKVLLTIGFMGSAAIANASDWNRAEEYYLASASGVTVLHGINFRSSSNIITGSVTYTTKSGNSLISGYAQFLEQPINGTIHGTFRDYAESGDGCLGDIAITYRDIRDFRKGAKIDWFVNGGNDCRDIGKTFSVNLIDAKPVASSTGNYNNTYTYLGINGGRGTGVTLWPFWKVANEDLNCREKPNGKIVRKLPANSYVQMRIINPAVIHNGNPWLLTTYDCYVIANNKHLISNEPFSTQKTVDIFNNDLVNQVMNSFSPYHRFEASNPYLALHSVNAIKFVQTSGGREEALSGSMTGFYTDDEFKMQSFSDIGLNSLNAFNLLNTIVPKNSVAKFPAPATRTNDLDETIALNNLHCQATRGLSCTVDYGLPYASKILSKGVRIYKNYNEIGTVHTEAPETSSSCYLPRNAALKYRNGHMANDKFMAITMDSVSGYCSSRNFPVGTVVYLDYNAVNHY